MLARMAPVSPPSHSGVVPRQQPALARLPSKVPQTRPHPPRPPTPGPQPRPGPLGPPRPPGPTPPPSPRRNRAARRTRPILPPGYRCRRLWNGEAAAAPFVKMATAWVPWLTTYVWAVLRAVRAACPREL